MTFTIAQLSRGEAAVIERLEPLGGAGPDPTGLRLQEMGLVPGTVVVLTRRAPWGDPLEIDVMGTRLCLRAAEAKRFVVRPVHALAQAAE